MALDGTDVAAVLQARVRALARTGVVGGLTVSRVAAPPWTGPGGPPSPGWTILTHSGSEAERRAWKRRIGQTEVEGATVEKEGSRVRVTVLYMDGCPATPPTVALIRDMAAALGLSIALERVRVETPDHATAIRFLGSPTVQVDGYDIEREARNAVTFGLT